MKNKHHGKKTNSKLYIWVLLIFFMMMAVVQPGSVQAVTDNEDIALQALRNNYHSYIQGHPVDGGWGNFSAFDGCIITQAGGDLASWVYETSSFQDDIITLIDNSINNEGTAAQSAAKRLAAEYLAASFMGDNTRADQLLLYLQERQAASGNGSFDSNAFSDIPAFDLLGRAGVIGEVDTADAITYILGEQSPSGAWTDSWEDLMSTAQAIRTLKYLQPYAGGQSAAVAEAIDKGCIWLQGNQMDNGSFRDSWGFDDPAVDSSEVVLTLDCLGMSQDSWVSGAGNSALDYILNESMNSDGTFGSSGNIASSTWVLDACLVAGEAPDAAAALDLGIEPESAVLKVTDTRQFTADIYNLGGNHHDVTAASGWSIGDEGNATVSNGLVTGVNEGQTVVTAVYGGLEASAAVTVERSSGGGNSGASQAQSISVEVAVVGHDGEYLFDPGCVRINSAEEYGLTVISALNATGLDWSFSERYPSLVEEIEGIANQGMCGWMYKVNEEVPSVPADEYELDSGDQVIWWYSDDPGASGPTWEQVETVEETGLDEVCEMLLAYQKDLEQSGEGLAVNGEPLSEQERAQLLERLEENEVKSAVEAGRAETIFTAPLQEIMLLVPENALDSTRILNIVELTGGKGPGQYAVEQLSPVYEFTPDGTRFGKPVLIGIKYPVQQGENLQRVHPAWYDQQSGEWQIIPGIIDLSTGLVFFQIDHFTSFAVIEIPEKVVFDDVNADMEWARPAIETLAGQGVIQGSGLGFEPGRTINRAEFVAMVARALQMEDNDAAATQFTDVQAGDWFFEALQAASREGLVSGFPDGSFRPLEMMTRNEAAAIIARIASEEASGSGDSYNYSDSDKIPAWAREGVQYCSRAGLMSGYEDGSFRGDNWLTRAEMALVFYRYLNLKAAQAE